MELEQFTIPWSFIRVRSRLTWRQAQFGIKNSLVDPGLPVEMAVDRLVEESDGSSTLLELASMGREEPVSGLVETLADEEANEDEPSMKYLWAYLALAWVYENRGSLADPLGVVESIYADMGYPEAIAKFVRYMPAVGPDLGSEEANERRLMHNWKEFIDTEADRRGKDQG
jgi:hypothetical protein